MGWKNLLARQKDVYTEKGLNFAGGNINITVILQICESKKFYLLFKVLFHYGLYAKDNIYMYIYLKE